MNFSLSRIQRRYVRAFFALLAAVAAGTLAMPDYVPALAAHDMQQTAEALIAGFLIVNPILDVGAGDAKGDHSGDDTSNSS
ncbi:MAG: hypothetical protein WB816_08895 [Methylocystis sp.]